MNERADVEPIVFAQQVREHWAHLGTLTAQQSPFLMLFGRLCSLLSSPPLRISSSQLLKNGQTYVLWFLKSFLLHVINVL